MKPNIMRLCSKLNKLTAVCFLYFSVQSICQLHVTEGLLPRASVLKLTLSSY